MDDAARVTSFLKILIGEDLRRPFIFSDTEYYNCAVVLEKYVMAKLRDHGLLDR